jgi:hypothetical protein
MVPSLGAFIVCIVVNLSVYYNLNLSEPDCLVKRKALTFLFVLLMGVSQPLIPRYQLAMSKVVHSLSEGPGKEEGIVEMEIDFLTNYYLLLFPI